MGWRPRVLIIVENLPVPFDRRTWAEATTLQKAGYAVSVISPKGRGAQETHIELEGIHIYRHPQLVEARGGLGFALEYACALFYQFALACWIFYRHGFDAIHACNPPDTIFLIGGFFKLIFGKKFVFDHHDINPELYEAKFGRKDYVHKALCVLERLSFRTADISIAPNLSYRRIALERGQMPPERVFVVRSGPRLEWLTDVPPVERLRCGRRFLVGYIGVIGDQEGLDLLIEAVRYLVQVRGRTDVHFRIVGDGPALNSMIELAKHLGVSDYMSFAGRVPDRDVLETLCTADICVNPDRVNEMNDKSTMNKIMEYMAMGRPIVQFEVAEGRYSALEASLYAKPNDPVDFAHKIVALLDDPDRRRAMGEFGRVRARTVLSWEQEAPHLLQAYATILPLEHLATSAVAQWPTAGRKDA